MTTSAPSALVVDGAVKRFGAQVALGGVSVRANGGIVALLGPNGAGKTTLLRSIATTLTLDEGRIFIDGLDTGDPRQRADARGRIGYSPQDPRFAPNATVFDVVDYFGIVRQHRNVRARHADVFRVLHEVGLADRARSRVRELSGGMVQRLSIAQALLGNPGLLVLDEPASGLDPEQRLLLRDRLSRAGEHATVILSTHLTEEAAAFAQALHVIDGGRILYSGTPDGLTAIAAGRVWIVDQAGRPGAAWLTWRTPDGRYRCVGEPPPQAELATPTLEDAYLLLVGTARNAAAA